MMSKLTSVRMGLSSETLEKIGHIEKKLKSANSATAIGSAVDIAETVLETLGHGGKIILEEPNGERYLMRVPGVH